MRIGSLLLIIVIVSRPSIVEVSGLRPLSLLIHSLQNAESELLIWLTYLKGFATHWWYIPKKFWKEKSFSIEMSTIMGAVHLPDFIESLLLYVSKSRKFTPKNFSSELRRFQDVPRSQSSVSTFFYQKHMKIPPAQASLKGEFIVF